MPQEWERHREGTDSVTDTTTSKSFSTTELISYAGVATPMQALLIPLIVFLPPFYAGVMETGGAGALSSGLFTVGFVFALARTWDALSDPIVGALSDRTESKWGRRKPWIAIGTPFLMLLTWMLLVPGESIGMFRLGLLIFFFYVVWTVVYIPYQSWGAEISTNYDERGKIAAFREGAGVLGIIIGMGVPLLLIDPIAQPARDLLWPQGLPLDNSLASLLKIMAVTIIIMLPVTVFAACRFFPKEKNVQASMPSWTQTMGVLKRNIMFRRLFLGYFFAQFGWLIYLSVIQLYITKTLKIEEHLFLVFMQHLVAIVLVPGWVWFAKKFGKHRAYCSCLGVMMVGVIMLGLLEEQNLWAALFVFLFIGIGAGGKLVLPSAMAADTVDYDTLQTGHREAGTHLALLNLANKITFATSIGVVYPVLGLIGFSSTGENSPEVLNMVRIITISLPLTVMIIGVAIMWNFPLDRKRHAEIRAQLETVAAQDS